jgi:hypothetical protein
VLSLVCVVDVDVVVCVAVCAAFLSDVCLAAGRLEVLGAAFGASAAAEASDIACVNPLVELGDDASFGAGALAAFVMGIEIRTFLMNATRKPN